MSKCAWVFPGQGSQFVGMGKDLPAAFSACAEVFAQADEILGFPLSRMCFEGPDEELKKTPNTQPAILAHSVAVSRVLEGEREKTRCRRRPQPGRLQRPGGGRKYYPSLMLCA